MIYNKFINKRDPDCQINPVHVAVVDVVTYLVKNGFRGAMVVDAAKTTAEAVVSGITPVTGFCQTKELTVRISNPSTL